MVMKTLKEWVSNDNARTAFSNMMGNSLGDGKAKIGDAHIIASLKQIVLPRFTGLKQAQMSNTEFTALVSIAQQSPLVAEFLLNTQHVWQWHKTNPDGGRVDDFSPQLLAAIEADSLLGKLASIPTHVRVEDGSYVDMRTFLENPNVYQPYTPEGADQIENWKDVEQKTLMDALAELVLQAKGPLVFPKDRNTTPEALIVAASYAVRREEELPADMVNTMLALAKQSKTIATILFEKVGFIARYTGEQGANNFMSQLSKEQIKDFLSDPTVSKTSRNILLDRVAPQGFFASRFPGSPGNLFDRVERLAFRESFKKQALDLNVPVVALPKEQAWARLDDADKFESSPVRPWARRDAADELASSVTSDSSVGDLTSLDDADGEAYTGPESPPVSQDVLVGRGFKTPAAPKSSTSRRLNMDALDDGGTPSSTASSSASRTSSWARASSPEFGKDAVTVKGVDPTGADDAKKLAATPVKQGA